MEKNNPINSLSQFKGRQKATRTAIKAAKLKLLYKICPPGLLFKLLIGAIFSPVWRMNIKKGLCG